MFCNNPRTTLTDFCGHLPIKELFRFSKMNACGSSEFLGLGSSSGMVSEMGEGNTSLLVEDVSQVFNGVL
jgi:hypothetical protein